MRIAICEDEKSARDELSGAIRDWAAARKAEFEISCYGSAEEFLMAWPEVAFDLAFLDIQMKNISGIELAESIRKTDKDMLIVFVTSFVQYVLKGYDVDALHYLIKPLSQAKLLPILDKARTIIDSRESDFLMVPHGDSIHKLPYGSILYISMLSHYADIYALDASYRLRKSAKDLMKLLPGYFIQCHRSYIVNLFKVDCIYKESLSLRDGKKLPLSRDRARQAKAAFMNLQMG